MAEIITPTGTVITIEQIDRKSIRTLVVASSAEMQEIAVRGENIFQYSLDLRDQVDAFARTLSEEQKETFYTIYAEELEASTNASNVKTAAIYEQTAQVHLQNAQNASNVATWMSLIIFFIFVIGAISIFKS